MVLLEMYLQKIKGLEIYNDVPGEGDMTIWAKLGFSEIF